MILQKYQTKKAFTLIELLIVIALIGIMVMVVLSISAGNKQDAQLNAATKELITNLRQAQNYALAGKMIEDDKTPCDFTIGNFSPVSTGTQYRLSYTYKNGSGCSPEQNSTTFVAKNVSISGNDSATFEVPFGGSSSATFYLEHKADSNKKKTVTVSSSGEIKEN